MRKSRTPGSVRGVSGNGYPYRDEINHVYLVLRYTQGVHGVHSLINHLIVY